MQKYLVTKVTDFYDGHGEAEAGESEKFISDSPIFEIIKDGDRFGNYSDLEDYTLELIKEHEVTKDNYTETLEGYYGDDVELGAEDGYHTTSQTYYFKPVTDQEAAHATYIIEEYAKL